MSMSPLYWGAWSWTQSSRVEQKHLSRPAVSTLSNAAQEVPLALLADVQLGVHQHLQVLLCQGVFQLGGLHHILVPGIFPPQVQDSNKGRKELSGKDGVHFKGL